MNSKEIDRVVFYSKEDMATDHNLNKVENLLNNFTPKQKLTINDLFEFYNIKLYFENGLFLKNWNDGVKKKYFEIVEKNWIPLKEKLIKIDDQNIELILVELDYRYENNFWDLINKLGIYKRLPKSKSKGILNNYISTKSLYLLDTYYKSPILANNVKV